MSITTLDGALAGFQPARPFAKGVTATMVAGRPQSLWPLAGAPGAGAWDATLNGSNLSSSSTIPNGAIPHIDPGSGNAYLARLSANATIAGTLLLCDRLWQDQLANTIVTSQSITQPTLPARDVAGSTNGDGVMLGLEINGTASSTAAALTSLTYTNQAGTGSHAATFLDAPTAVAGAVGQFYRFALQAGDTGVRNVASIQFSTAWTSGTFGLVAYRVLASLELAGAFIPNAIDILTGGFARLYNGAVPFLIFIPSTTTASNVSGLYTESQG